MAFNALFNDDIFISYSRRDGSDYVVGLDNELAKKGFSCFTDNKGTDAGKEPPADLYRRIRASKMLIFLGTPGAVAKSEYVAREVAEFAEANGTLRIVPISFDRGEEEITNWDGTLWWEKVQGKTRLRESPEALKTGIPSPGVISRIIEMSDYTKNKDRLRRYRNVALATFLFLIAGSVVAVGLGIKWAADAAAKAEQAEKDAGERINKAQAQVAQAEAEAKTKIERADERATAADVKRQDAETAAGKAQEQAGKAEKAAKAAGEKQRVAEVKTREAESLRQKAQADADRQQAIADSRSFATRSQTLLRQRPLEVPRSLTFAMNSMEKSSAIGAHMVEADTALRDSLALFPRLRRSDKYATGFVAALSPDGRHFATLSDKLRIYASGNQTPLKELTCECSMVALSSGLAYVAALTEGGFKIFDLKDDARSHFVKFEDGVAADIIALSPGGRYLAFSSVEGEDMGRYSKLTVVETASGKTIKTFDDELTAPVEEGDSNASTNNLASGPSVKLDLVINNIAFGPSGNLAVGGKYTTQQGRLIRGRVIYWPLFRVLTNEWADPELTDDSFSAPEIITQDSVVFAVAPGTDDTYFATDMGIWKRMSGQTRYEPIARLPYSRPYESASSIGKMAFSPHDGSFTLIRDIEATGDEPDGKDEEVFEVWDAIGHRDLAQVFLPKKIVNLGFKPGGQFVATITEQVSEDEPIRVFQAVGGKEIESATAALETEGRQVLYNNLDIGYLITTGEDSAQVWSAWGKPTMMAQFGDALQSVEVATLSPDGKFLALSGPTKESGQLIVVYRLDGGSYKEWKRLPQNATPLKVLLSADGQRLAALYGDSVDFARIWDVSGERGVTPESLMNLTNISVMAFSPGGRFLVVAVRDNRTHLLDLSKGRMVELLNDTRIDVAAFSTDERYLGLGSGEGVLHVFETNKPEDEIARLQHTGSVTAIAFSDDDRYVATASSDPHAYAVQEEESYPLRVWLLQPKDLLAEAAERLAVLSRPER